MPYPRLHTIWRVSVTKLSIVWMYGRVVSQGGEGITEVSLTLDAHARLRDYESKKPTPTVRYFETFQDAAKFLQSCILLEAGVLTKLWKKSKRQKHGRGITKAKRLQ